MPPLIWHCASASLDTIWGRPSRVLMPSLTCTVPWVDALGAAVRCGQCGPSCAQLGRGFMNTRQHGGQLARSATHVPLRVGQTWRCLASMDSDFEAFSRNPTDGSFAVLAFQLAAFSGSSRSSNRLSSAISRSAIAPSSEALAPTCRPSAGANAWPRSWQLHSPTCLGEKARPATTPWLQCRQRPGASAAEGAAAQAAADACAASGPGRGLRPSITCGNECAVSS